MSTTSEHLEATVWLESRHPDISDEQRIAFFTAVDAYYAKHPVTSRGPDPLDILREDDRAFAAILYSITGEDLPPTTSPSVNSP